MLRTKLDSRGIGLVSELPSAQHRDVLHIETLHTYSTEIAASGSQPESMASRAPVEPITSPFAGDSVQLRPFEHGAVAETGAHWLDYVTAFGTAGAAIVAAIAILVTLWVNVWRELRRRPKLSLRVVDRPGYGPPAWDLHSEEESGSFTPLDIEVRNQNGRRTARKVEVLLTAAEGVWGEPEKADWVWFEDTIELARLAWVHGRLQEEWRTSPADIPAGLAPRVRVGLVGHPKTVMKLLPTNEGHSDVRGYGLGLLTVPPFDRNPHTYHWLQTGYSKYGSLGAAWKLRFTIVGENTDAEHYTTSLRVIPRVRDDGTYEVVPTWGPLEKDKN